MAQSEANEAIVEALLPELLPSLVPALAFGVPELSGLSLTPTAVGLDDTWLVIGGQLAL